MIHKEKLEQEMFRVSNEHCNGTAPRQKDMIEYGNFSNTPYSNVYGSWNEALIEIGFEINSRGKVRKDELLDEIQRISNFCDGTPAESDIEKYGKYSISSYRRKFDSWNNALIEAGFNEMNDDIIEEDKLIKEMRRLAEELNRSPRISDMSERGEFSESPYKKRFGSWNKALKKCELEINVVNQLSDDELINELIRLSDEYMNGSEGPYIKTMLQYGKYSMKVYCNRFGSWNNALEKAGFEKRNCGEGKEYGENWDKKRKEAIKRDEASCKVCRKSSEDIGQEPDVHHIKPVKLWDNDEKETMNDLSNLICLCRSCHRKFEGMWKEAEVDEFASNARKQLIMDGEEA